MNNKSKVAVSIAAILIFFSVFVLFTPVFPTVETHMVWFPETRELDYVVTDFSKQTLWGCSGTYTLVELTVFNNDTEDGVFNVSISFKSHSQLQNHTMGIFICALSSVVITDIYKPTKCGVTINYTIQAPTITYYVPISVQQFVHKSILQIIFGI
jgi:hypothetical protein